MDVGTTKFYEDLACALELVKDYRADAHGWRPLSTNQGTSELHIFCRDGPPGKMELNLRMDMPMPIDMATTWLRAEDILKEAPYADMIDEFVCLKSFGPGDMICSIKFTKQFGILVDLLASTRPPDSFGDKILMRFVTRRDHPEPGHIFFGCIAIERASFVPMWGMMIKEGTKPGTTTLHEIWQVPSMPDDLVLPVVEQMGRIYCAQTWNIDDSAGIEQRHGFLVMAIRKCCRGPPLIPIAPKTGDFEPCSEEWLDALTWDVYEDPLDFTLPQYLRLLLECFGKKNVDVFDSLDGRHLLFYQASARRSNWLEIWGVWQLIQQRHSAAYRRYHGGSGAPGFQGDVEPRFGKHLQPVSPSTTPTTEDLAAEDTEEYPWSSGLPVKNTFVHFPPDRATFDLQSSPI